MTLRLKGKSLHHGLVIVTHLKGRMCQREEVQIENEMELGEGNVCMLLQHCPAATAIIWLVLDICQLPRLDGLTTGVLRLSSLGRVR